MDEIAIKSPLNRTPIVLLTDFGGSSVYVGQMKGVLAALAPGHPVIDLTHDVSPQDAREGAFLLEVSYGYFPKGSVFLAVVDPGVGTERRPIAVKAKERWFVGPDNGLIPGALPEGSIRASVRIEPSRLKLASVSDTFHGRDLFAPAGAALAVGSPLTAIGPILSDLIPLAGRYPTQGDSSLIGRIVHVDRFGNLLSDISRAHLEALRARSEGEPRVEIGAEKAIGIQRTYGDAKPDETLALIGSMGYLEVAVNQGSAGSRLSAGKGSRITVSVRRDETPSLE